MFFAEQRADRIAYVGWPPVTCQTDDSCKGINGSYCMNDKTKTAPYFCHEPIVTLVDGLSRPVGCSIDSSTQQVFYTEDDQQGGDTEWPLSAVNVDGTGKMSVVPKLLDPQGIDLDTAAKKIYFTEHHGQRVGVVDYDGTNRKVLHSFSGNTDDAVFPSDVAVDAVNGYLFVQVESSASTGGQLVRMGLDGSNPLPIVKDIVRAYGVTVNPETKTLYYISGGHGGFIGNVSYDGKEQGVVLGGLEWPFEINIDHTMQRLVFSTTGVGDGKIQTMNLNGTDIDDVMELGFAPMGLSFGKLPVQPTRGPVRNFAAFTTSIPPQVKCPDTPANYCDCGGGDHGYRWYCRANNGLVWETNDAVPSSPCPCKYPQCTTHPDFSRSAWLVEHLTRAEEQCIHAEDLVDHKCNEACAGAKFATKGITSPGSCPDKYNSIDKTVNVRQCPDGVTQLRYCPDTALNVTVTTKGIASLAEVVPL